MIARIIFCAVFLPLLGAFPVKASASDLLIVESGDARIEFTTDDLAALDQISFATSTIWTEGVVKFEGPTLQSLIALAGITEGDLTLTASNDYAIQIPVDEITDTAPIVAHRINGAAFSRREKGPYWVVYPYDSDAQYKTEITYARSIWQLASIKKKHED